MTVYGTVTACRTQQSETVAWLQLHVRQLTL